MCTGITKITYEADEMERKQLLRMGRDLFSEGTLKEWGMDENEALLLDGVLCHIVTTAIRSHFIRVPDINGTFHVVHVDDVKRSVTKAVSDGYDLKVNKD